MAEKTKAQWAEECMEWRSGQVDWQTRANRLEARIIDLEEALTPFANAVYNDNGDVTISTSHIDHGQWLRARRVLREGT